MASKFLKPKQNADTDTDAESKKSGAAANGGSGDRYEKANKTMKRGYNRESENQHYTRSFTTTDADLKLASEIRMRLFKHGIEPSRSEVINLALGIAANADDDDLIKAIQARRS